jgi:putative membrane protein
MKIVKKRRIEEPPHTLSNAVKGSTPTELAMIGVMLAFYLAMSVTWPITWARHDAGLQMQAATYGTLVMYAVCVWHSVQVKGPRQTVAFFLLAGVITYFAEYLGSNYGWLFGEYEYTETLGPRLGGVPLLVPFAWGVLIYSSFMVVDWLSGLRGERRGTTRVSKVVWSALIALATGVAVCAWDLMGDPFGASGVWMEVLGRQPWWWWAGGTYLPDLQVWQGSGGIPVKNFIGWVEVTFIIIFIFHLFFQQRDKVTNKLINVIPFLAYGYLYYSVILALLGMNWYDPGIHQAALIGTFAMGPILMLGIIKLFKDYSRPAQSLKDSGGQLATRQ